MPEEPPRHLEIPLTPIELEPPRAIPVAGPAPDRNPSSAGGVEATATSVASADRLDVEGEGIYCTVCNYNLTGILSGRCPECGSMFHREALLEAQRSNRVTLIPWDSPRYMPRVQRLWETLRICLFKADRFAFAFSVQPQRTRAWSFFVGVLFATLGITAAIAAMDVGLNPDQFRSLNDTILTLIGALLFTSLLVAGTTLATAIMLWLTNPHYDGQRHFTPWLSICCYASSHYLMVAIVLPFTPMAMTMTGGLVMINTGLVLVGCGGLCGFTLNAVMKHRTARHRRSTIGPVLLFVIYLAAPFCAIGATGFVVYFVDTYIF